LISGIKLIYYLKRGAIKRKIVLKVTKTTRKIQTALKNFWEFSFIS